MKSLAIIWNTVYQYKDEILNDLSTYSKISKVIDIDLNGDYEKFVRDVYKSEDMDTWKIDNKLAHMLNIKNRRVALVYIDIDLGEVVYHDKKKKNVFSNVENCKTNIREKYSKKIKDYYFDNVLHMTDNEKEYSNCLNAISGYLVKYKESEIEK